MSRLLIIAWREYVAFVRTPGFWLSIFLLPVGFSTLGLVPLLMDRATPTSTLVVVDLTGRSLTGPIADRLRSDNTEEKPTAIIVPAPGGSFASGDEAIARLKPYLVGPRTLPSGQLLGAVAILRPDNDTVAIDLWSRNVSNRPVAQAIGEAVTSEVKRDAMAKVGVDPAVVAHIASLKPHMVNYSPKAATGRVTLRDRLPGVVGLAMGLLLWMAVLTGAGMLLGSVIEEKTSRILEVLLSSASVPEIMGGKILGVAGVTGTVLAFWVVLAITVVETKFPMISSDLTNILIGHGLLVYFTLYFVGGYLMFATLYVTVGAFCESPREAQTLLAPMMIVMTVPLVFMSQALTRPDAPMLTFLSFIPPFTPFMMAARAATDPPAWQIVSTLALMAGFTALELWVSIPAFKSGALTSGRFDIRNFFLSLARRGKT